MKSREKIWDSNYLIYYKKNNLEKARFGIAIPKKIAKKASTRNLFKRQIRNIISKIFNYEITEKERSVDFVIIIKREFIEKDFFGKEKSLHNLIKKVYGRKEHYQASKEKRNTN